MIEVDRMFPFMSKTTSEPKISDLDCRRSLYFLLLSSLQITIQLSVQNSKSLDDKICTDQDYGPKTIFVRSHQHVRGLLSANEQRSGDVKNWGQLYFHEYISKSKQQVVQCHTKCWRMDIFKSSSKMTANTIYMAPCHYVFGGRHDICHKLHSACVNFSQLR